VTVADRAPRDGARRAVLALGSNLGDRVAHLQGAVDGLATTEGVVVVAVSSVYETDPMGPDQPDYLNAAVAVDTTRTPHELLGVAQSLEQAAGRVRRERWGPRTLDVDVLFVGDLVVDTPDLVLPHPGVAQRAFVLAPLSDVAPELVPADLPAEVRDEGDWRGVRPTSVRLSLGT
jgi:2-amino-4-hydroxy-6-hydroxymethyldihydropteridine diphosphokinase